MAERMRALDWSRTAIGPLHTWPQCLLSAVGMLLPSKAQIILFWGPEFTVLYNAPYRPVFGARHPWPLGRPGREAWPEIWDDMLHGLLDGVIRTGEAFGANDLLFPIERNGYPEETYFDVSYDPIRDESGSVAGVYCIVTETTARVVGERRLALLKELGATNAGALTARHACVRAVQAFEQQPQDIPFALVYAGDELLGSTKEARQQLDAAPAVQVQERPLLRANGTPMGRLVFGLNPKRPYDAQYAAFIDLVAGQVSTAIANAQAYDDERRRAEALAELDRAKTVFFSNVSHELRTPLTLILGPVEDLLRREDGGNAGAREPLELVYRNALRLLRLVNTLLDFSRIEAGRIQAAYQPTDLAAFTIDLASMFRSAFEKAGLRLVVDCAPLDELVFVDRSMWEKIVLNLLSNAFKYTLDGEVDVVLRRAGDAVELSVRDTGTGIPAEALPRVFDRFHRVEGARGRSSEGSGIGLALVAELVKLHGGSVQARSVPGEGSDFFVRLPFGHAHLPAQHLGKDEPASGSSIAADPYVEEALRWLPEGAGPDTLLPAAGLHAAPDDAEGERPRVLVADDNADMRQYLQRLLASHYTVQTVPDGAAALQAALAEPPALVLTDIMMPRLDGYGLLAALRGHEATRRLPVLMLSARAGDGYRVEALKAGADDYIVKPFAAGELLARVATHLQMARERAEAIRTLSESEERYRALVAATADAVYRMNADWSEMRYLQGREFIPDTQQADRSWLEKYILPEDQPQVLAAVRAAIARKNPFQLEHRVLRVDGSTGWTASRAVPVLGPDGEIAEWFGAASDVSARRQAEEALKDADRRKDEFLAVLSHELRNPLAPLRNGIQLLGMLSEPQALQRTRVMMERQISQIVRLVDDLLDMTRINQGKVRLRSERLDLCAVVLAAADSARPAMEQQKHRLAVELPQQPIRVHADAVRLGQVLGNLLNNAAKFTPEGGEIHITADVDAGQARVRVRDTGIGIPAHKLHAIFDMFTQVDPSTERSRSGLGIGLTLARRLVELHGGTLAVRSEGPGRGSEFTVRLPVEAAGPARAANADGAPAGRSKRKLRRILVVDDNVDAANTIAVLLGSQGHDAHTCNDAGQALAKAERLRPDVILMDIGMPGLSGWELCRLIREQPWGHAIAIHALTGYGQPDDRQRSLAAGFDGHMTKPVDFGELERVLADRPEEMPCPLSSPMPARSR
ncbi:response regulator [Ramlibacter sp. G-1-2-2]|uniref:histidine kinase n=2 Tax=Ramlibacter agri TaxID=2728837 RepID=A0A848HEX3_9BURK|nr:response regulator [Ramlibacter agri]